MVKVTCHTKADFSLWRAVEISPAENADLQVYSTQLMMGDE
jgi:hypothetical protein